MFLSVASQIPTVQQPQNLIDLYSEYWTPYSTELIQPGITPTIGRTFADSIRQDRVDSVIANKLKDYILFDVHGDGGSNWLIWARDNQPSDDLPPSSEWESDETWQWPAILRDWSVQFVVSNGALLDILVDTSKLIPRQQLSSRVIFQQWWTTVPWPFELRLRLQMQPSLFEWKYPGNFSDAKGSVECLRPINIQVPPIPGGLAGYSGIISRGVEFPKTNTGYWVPDKKYFKQDQIRGRWFSELAMVQPPYSPVIYPKLPVIYAS